MPAPIRIRPAQPDDAEIAAHLLYSAYAHTPVAVADAAEPPSGWAARLAIFFRQPGNRFSYQNARVAEASAGIVGLVLSFAGRDEAQLNAGVGIGLAQEAEPDEWYVDAVAVVSDWSRQGIGTALLLDAERMARQQRYRRVALNVAQENEPALRLYLRLDYQKTRATVLYGQPHIRMVKPLAAGASGNDHPALSSGGA